MELVQFQFKMHIPIEEVLKHIFTCLEIVKHDYFEDLFIPIVAFEFNRFGSPLAN